MIAFNPTVNFPSIGHHKVQNIGVQGTARTALSVRCNKIGAIENEMAESNISVQDFLAELKQLGQILNLDSFKSQDNRGH